MTQSLVRAARVAVVGPALAVTLAAALTACGGGGGGSDQDSRTPTQVLRAAQRTLDETSGVQVSMSTGSLPSGVTGIVSASGTGTHPTPTTGAFEGTFRLSAKGLPAEADVVAVDGVTYAKSSLLLPDWTQIDPADYGAPDPIGLMKPGTGFSGLLSATTGLERGKTVRGGQDNKEILTSYTGVVPSEAVAAIIPSASGDFDVTYSVTDDDQLREAVIRGRFYAGSGPVTYTLDLEDYGTKKDIQAPS